jgi:sugar-specific transcriptional regulator TrmB
MADTLDITTHLFALGLDELEAKTYLHLLKTGVSPILSLSKYLSLPRTSTYRLCQKLVDRQFLEWVVTRQGNHIQVIPPSRLTGLINRAKSHLHDIQNAITTLDQFHQTLGSSLPQTQVRYYHGKEGMMQVIWNTLQAKNGIIGYSGFYRSDIVGSKFEDHYVEERNPLKITDTVIINAISPSLKKTFTHNPESLKYTRFHLIADSSFTITGDTYIYNDIYAVNFWNSGDIVGVEIQNPELVSLQTNIFNQLLPLTTPITPTHLD